jgi:hypothetical protein
MRCSISPAVPCVISAISYWVVSVRENRKHWTKVLVAAVGQVLGKKKVAGSRVRGWGLKVRGGG